MVVPNNLFPEAAEEDWGSGDQVDDSSVDQVQFGRSWFFDWDTRQFVMTPTKKVAKTDDTDAWVVWCQKAVRTARYRHIAYSQDYGSEFEDLIGKGYSQAFVESEIQRMVTEALMVDPRTADVGQFSFKWDGEACSFSCRITNVRDEEETLEGSVLS